MGKFIHCEECKDNFMLINKITRHCLCGKCAGKYLKDNVTAVVNKGSSVFGIDNNSFNHAVQLSEHFKKEVDFRLDSFFTGWFPNFPGEIIWVDDIQDVIDYDYETEITTISTNPSTDKNEKE
jgi:hypothetical protein